jgi:hypothetical protein
LATFATRGLGEIEIVGSRNDVNGVAAAQPTCDQSHVSNSAYPTDPTEHPDPSSSSLVIVHSAAAGT